MSFDDDIDPKTKRHKPRLLDNLSVPDLKAYIDQLREEITRVEAEVTRKEKHLSAADALFRKKD